jgi:hypothetical protein
VHGLLLTVTARHVGSMPIPPDLQAPAPDLGRQDREPSPEHRESSVGGWPPSLSTESFVDATEVMENGPDDVYVEREGAAREDETGVASAWFGLDHAELVALGICHRRPTKAHIFLEVLGPGNHVPETGSAKADQALDLGFAVEGTPIQVHSILRALAFGNPIELKLRIARERHPSLGIVLDELTLQRGRPEPAHLYRVIAIEDNVVEGQCHVRTVLIEGADGQASPCRSLHGDIARTVRGTLTGGRSTI